MSSHRWLLRIHTDMAFDLRSTPSLYMATVNLKLTLLVDITQQIRRITLGLSLWKPVSSIHRHGESPDSRQSVANGF